jgi:hypothetical protein
VMYAEALSARPQANITHCGLVACEAWGPPQHEEGPAQLLWQGFPSSTALDDMAWAAAWLHAATGAAEASAVDTYLSCQYRCASPASQLHTQCRHDSMHCMGAI